ncbi:multiple organellar RNA editing factor 3, mitochondrial-like [Rutidosis leptorrhynchoides]|uniref:multiple organellar RNA editing factor 3, mitochondrial-like n=1 Tax=Rutidosis leptorrhynchoides TaxID=125765 RepID=UPI003A997012
MEFPTDPKPSEDEMINSYVKIIAIVLESEEEAKKKVCSVSTTTSTGFGFLLWNQTRQQWVGDKAPDTSKNLDNPL